MVGQFLWKLKCSTKTNFFKDLLNSSKIGPILVESDDGIEVVNKIFTNLLNNINITRYSWSTYLRAVFAERFNLSIRDLLKIPVFERRDANWIDVLPIITKQKNNSKHSSTEKKPTEASSKKDEKYVFEKLFDRKKIKTEI